MFGSDNTPDLMNKINDYLYTLEQTHGVELDKVTVEHRSISSMDLVFYSALIYYEFFSDKTPEELDFGNFRQREIER